MKVLPTAGFVVSELDFLREDVMLDLLRLEIIGAGSISALVEEVALAEGVDLNQFLAGVRPPGTASGLRGLAWGQEIPEDRAPLPRSRAQLRLLHRPRRFTRVHLCAGRIYRGPWGEGPTFGMAVRAGDIYATLELGGDCLLVAGPRDAVLSLRGSPPETILAGIRGAPVGKIVRHPLLEGAPYPVIFCQVFPEADRWVLGFQTPVKPLVHPFRLSSDRRRATVEVVRS